VPLLLHVNRGADPRAQRMEAGSMLDHSRHTQSGPVLLTKSAPRFQAANILSSFAVSLQN